MAIQPPIRWVNRLSQWPGFRSGYDARTEQEQPMMDILMIALALAFFAAAIGYTYACERL
jgi:hypothetical protein